MTVFFSDQLSSNPLALVPGYTPRSGLGDERMQTYICIFDVYPFPSDDDHTHGTDLLASEIAADDVIVLCPLSTQNRLFYVAAFGSDDTDSPLTTGGGWNAVATPASLEVECGIYVRTATGALGEVIDSDFASGAADQMIHSFLPFHNANWTGQHVYGEVLAEMYPCKNFYGAGSENEDNPLYLALKVTTASGLTKGGRITAIVQIKGN